MAKDKGDEPPIKDPRPVKDSVRKDRSEKVRLATAKAWREKSGDVLDNVKGQARLEFYAEPDFILDDDGEVIGVDAWVRLFDGRGKEVPIDPHRRIINPPTVPRGGVREIPNPQDPKTPGRELTPDPMAAFLEAVWDSVEEVPNPKGWRTKGTVTTVFGDASDGFATSSGGNYTTSRSGPAGAVNTTAAAGVVLVEQSLSGGTYFLREGYLAFDTSSIADTDVVSSVQLEFWLGSDGSTQDFTVEFRDFDWGATLTTSDWVPGASLSTYNLVASIATSGIGSVGAYKAPTSTADFLTVNNLKTGTVRVVVGSDRLRLGSAPANAVSETITTTYADNSGTTQDPKLTITHAAPPPAGAPLFQRSPNRIWRRF